jgi:hypothetical protein
VYGCDFGPILEFNDRHAAEVHEASSRVPSLPRIARYLARNRRFESSSLQRRVVRI